jgi:manganese transport system substrate-binding protein
VSGGLVALSGCGSASGEASSDRPVVLTTFTVIADMTRQVAGNRIDVASITKVGSEIHGYEPTPSDLRRADDADLILGNGLGLERWFEQFIDRSKARRVTLSAGVTPIPIAGDSSYAGRDNPHAWMSPANGEIYVTNIEKALTELDPEGAETYRANAERYRAELRAVGTRLTAELKTLPPSQRALVTCEGAFSYLARDTGLREAYLWPVNAEQEGTPRQIASVVSFVRQNAVPAVFCESTVSNKGQQQVARESGARFGGVLYVDSLSEADGPVPTYLDLLQHDADIIVSGLTGAPR